MQTDSSRLLKQLQEELSRQCSFPAEGAVTREQLEQLLADHVRYLLDKDFHQLIHLIYRIDVPEAQLKEMLAVHPDQDAAVMIAGLILDRLRQKIITRQTFGRGNEDPSDEQRW